MRCSVAVLAVVVILVSFFIACSKKTDTISIGVILPLTGEAAFYGQSIKNGLDISAEQINSDGGLHGSKLSLIYEDSRALPAEGVGAFQKLTSTSGVKAIVGDAVSSVTLAFAPLAEKKQIVVISPLSSAPAISQAGDYIFRNVPSDLVNGTTAADYLIGDRGFSKVGILYINNDFGIGLRDAFSQRINQLGAEVVSAESYEPESADFRSQLTKISAADPTAVFLVGYAKLAQALIQAKEMGLDMMFIGTGLMEDPNFVKTAGGAAEGVLFTQLGYDPSTSDTVVTQFVEAYANKYHDQPNIMAAYGYDALLVLAYAMSRSNMTPEDIKAQMYVVNSYHGVTGKISFDRNGDVMQPMGIRMIKDGKFVWVKRPPQSEIY